MRKWWVIGAVVFAGAFLVGALVLPVVQVRRDWAFKCENTGSEHRYTVWLGVVRKNDRKRSSELEKFIRQRYPNEFTNRWVSFAGTGRNIFGKGVLYGHGRPALRTVKTEMLDEYTAELSDIEKKKLYDFLRTATHEEALAKAKEIWEAVISKGETE